MPMITTAFVIIYAIVVVVIIADIQSKLKDKTLD